MSSTPPPTTYDDEVEEGIPFGGAECEESSPEPQQPAAEEQEEHLYPFDSLAVEYYDDGASYSKEMYNDTADPNDQDLGEDTNASNTYDSGDPMLDESIEPDYKELQQSYFDMYSNTSSFDEGSNSNFDETREEPKGSPLGRFSKIAKAVEIAEYETLQVLYQLLYQRSAWDTQQILSQRILEFSGFTFNEKSEDYFNREMMLRTQPGEILVKLGAILGLPQIQKMLFDMDGGRPELIAAIMNFLSRPNKRTHAGLKSNDKSIDTVKTPLPKTPTKCGCRSRCPRKFNQFERARLLEYMQELEEKKLSEKYLCTVMEFKKIQRDPSDSGKKLKEVNYQYKCKYGRKDITVCKGAFMSLHGITMSKMNNLQIKIKAGKAPIIQEGELPPLVTAGTESISRNEPSVSRKVSQNVKDGKAWVSSEEQVRQLDEEVTKSIQSVKTPKVAMGKCDIKTTSAGFKSENKENSSDSNGSEQQSTETKKLKELPLVVSAIEGSSEELLLDVHFLLFLTSADTEKVKENILEFEGFTFDCDTEEYDERYEFLQRMSAKIVSEVARSFSLDILTTKAATIKNILTFLTNPNESFLKETTSLPLSLSDVELDDIGDMSDSDVSITCEVVEKKVECIDILSSGEDSDREDKPKKEKKATPQKAGNILKKALVPAVKPSMVQVQKPQVVIPSLVPDASTSETQPIQTAPGGKRYLRNFETICKIVHTHPHEYLVDIHELLYLQKHNPDTLRDDILNFSGFDFDKSAPDYVKRKQLLDRMLYNSVRRIYNTLIHNTTEVKVFSKPTMITEIFQFLFNLPPIDTSVRPNLPTVKLPTVKPLMMTPTVMKSTSIAPPITSMIPPGGPVLPNQSGKLSDLKRVFQRVACFPCEYLVDVHKLLFMTDCDAKVIRNNIFAFKGFNFASDSQDFQQRKMYLEYLTFHSLRKISSVLTTRSVDLRNSTKHELATHLTQVLAEYCTDHADNDAEANNMDNQSDVSSSSAVENIVVTPLIDPSMYQSNNDIYPMPSVVSSIADNVSITQVEKEYPNIGISIVDARSVNSPSISTTTNSRGRKKSSGPVKIKPKPRPQESATISPSTTSESLVYEQLNESDDTPPKKKAKLGSSKDSKPVHNNIRDAINSDDEDCDKPLSSLVGHPIDTVLKKNIVDIVEESDLASITINGVIQKIFGMYPKFDLSYRKEFIKSTLRSMLYRLGEQNKSDSTEKRETNSPDCSVTTTKDCDTGSVESPKSAMECS